MLSKANVPFDCSVVESSRAGDPVAANDSPGKWIPRCPTASKSNAVRLFCFPFAGGGASAFAKWRSSFPDTVEVCPIQYPGREERWGEPGFGSVESLVEALANDLAPFWVGRFAFFGHSFGALVAFELARALSWRGDPVPLRLFLSAARAPQLPPRESIHELPDQDFLNKLCQYNGMPDEVLRNADLMSVILPMIREDFRLFEQHCFHSAPPIPVPISVFGGLKDGNVPAGDLLAWFSQTNKGFRSRFLEGDHFFLFDARSKFVSYIVEDLEVSAGEIDRLSSFGERTDVDRHE
jgi:surfactin synthase thioesterase subunit